MHHKDVLTKFYNIYSWVLLLKLKSVCCSDPLVRFVKQLDTRKHDNSRGVPAAGAPMSPTFSQVSPRLESLFDSSDFLRLSGVSAAARHRLGSTSLLRANRLSKKGEKDTFSHVKMWKISLVPIISV